MRLPTFNVINAEISIINLNLNGSDRTKRLQSHRFKEMFEGAEYDH